MFEPFLMKMCLLLLQVSELVVQYNREHLTVWGNARNQIVKKCYKEVNKGNRREAFI